MLDRQFNLRRLNVRRFITVGVAVFSILWTVTDAWNSLVPSLAINGGQWLICFAAVSLVGAMYVGLPKASVRIFVPTTNTTISILFGDLFAQQSHIVIPVNEFFDSELGEPVSEKSLHGMLIRKIFGGNSAAFERAIEASLCSQAYNVIPRTRGRNRQYPIGTTAVLNWNDQKYFLVALCHTDLETLKASASIIDLWQAVEGLWRTIHVQSGGTVVAIPLIGGGLAGVGLPPTQLLQLLILAIVNGAKTAAVASEIRIVLHQSMRDNIDTDSIAGQWSADGVS